MDNAFRPVKTLCSRPEVLRDLVLKNLKARYAGFALGLLWAFISPLLFAGIISFVFTEIFRMQGENFYLFIISGMLPWAFFAGAVQEAAVSIPAQASMLKQFSLPREFIPVSAVCVHFILFLLGLLVLMPFFLKAYPQAILMLPLLGAALVLHFLFTSGLALVCCAAYVYYKDISQILVVLLSFWLWLTPVFYSVDMIPTEYRGMMAVNPLTPFIDLYRKALLGTGAELWPLLAVASLEAGIMVIVGYAVFYRHEKSFLKQI